MLSIALPTPTIVASAASNPCPGGVIALGTYQSLQITKDCSIPSGTVVVLGGLTIKRGASLNASSPAATVTVSGGVSIERDGIFILGCSASFPCPGSTSDVVYGGVRADHPLAVILHGNTIDVGISMEGVGGGVNCAPNSHLSSVLGFGPIPAYSGFENNTINGSVSVSEYGSCWLGFVRNQVRGTVTFEENTLSQWLAPNVPHPDAFEVESNAVQGSLACFENQPALVIDVEAEVSSTPCPAGRQANARASRHIVLLNARDHWKSSAQSRKRKLM
jgi:hypothetical protein